MIDLKKYIRPAKTRIRPALLRRWALFLLLLTAVTVFLAAPPPAHAGRKNLQEYKIKAAFIYNFAKYVSWPKNIFVDKNEPLVLGLLGDNPFGKEIYKINDKLVHDRRLKVVVIKDYEEIKSCNLLYISPSESARLDKIKTTLKRKKILTISDIDNFAADGGMIELVIKEGRIKFIINPKAAERAGLEISSQLLKLAIIAKPES